MLLPLCAVVWLKQTRCNVLISKLRGAGGWQILLPLDRGLMFPVLVLSYAKPPCFGWSQSFNFDHIEMYNMTIPIWLHIFPKDKVMYGSSIYCKSSYVGRCSIWNKIRRQQVCEVILQPKAWYSAAQLCKSLGSPELSSLQQVAEDTVSFYVCLPTSEKETPLSLLAKTYTVLSPNIDRALSALFIDKDVSFFCCKLLNFFFVNWKRHFAVVSLFSLSVLILSFWIYWYDRHDLYSHWSLRYISLCLAAGNEVCVSVVCLLLNSPHAIMGFLSECAAAIISSHSGFDCRLNAQIVVVNSVHLWVVFCVCNLYPYAFYVCVWQRDLSMDYIYIYIYLY